MAGSSRGPAGAAGVADSVKDNKTSPLVRTPAPGLLGVQYFGDDSVSFELSDAPFVCVPTKLNRISLSEMRVLEWLRLHKSEIIAAEAKYSVDRRAIAGAIAWESLKNNKTWTNFFHSHGGWGRSVGPGKVHLSNSIFFGGVDNTWSNQVEQQGILAIQTEENRKALLKTPSGAIQYIAAAMDLIATIYEKQGSPGTCDPPIRENASILANQYQGIKPKEWKERVREIKPGEILKPGNAMALWLLDPRNMDLIEDGVGSPSAPVLPDSSEEEFDNKAFAEYMNLNAFAGSTGYCATSVRKGLEAGGLDTDERPRDAKDYGSFLVQNGYRVIPKANYFGAEQLGDIAVIQPAEGHKLAGHIEMWNGNQWVSDWKQRRFSPYPDFEASELDYKIYRL